MGFKEKVLGGPEYVLRGIAHGYRLHSGLGYDAFRTIRVKAVDAVRLLRVTPWDY